MKLDNLNPLFEAAGFRKRGHQIFTLDLARDVLGWIGLNTATKRRRPGEVEVNPVVGVRHTGVERLVAELRGEKPHAYVPATIATPLGYLMPERRYNSWVITAENAHTTGAEMIAAITEYGIPFMQSMMSLDALARALEPSSRLATEDVAVYRRPVVWLLLNEHHRALATLETATAALGDRADLAAADFRRFGEALRERLLS